jgi:hypothetical protein
MRRSALQITVLTTLATLVSVASALASGGTWSG